MKKKIKIMQYKMQEQPPLPPYSEQMRRAIIYLIMAFLIIVGCIIGILVMPKQMPVKEDTKTEIIK